MRGAGGLIYQTGLTLTGIYNINVGKGGNGGDVVGSSGFNGNNSSLGTYVAIGGGFGSAPNTTNVNGGNGGYGGGAVYSSFGLGKPGQGNNVYFLYNLKKI